MRQTLVLAAVAATVTGTAVLSTPAHAVDGPTTVALTVVDGVLAIATTPVAAGVSSEIVGTGRTFTAPLGVTTITDTRAASTGWSFSATSTAFALTGTPTTTIPASAATFSLSAAPTNTVGANTYSGTATSPTTGTLVTATATGINAATLTPVLHVAVPNSTPIGVYTGTVTQSVV